MNNKKIFVKQIFDDISYIIKDKKGIFVSKRDSFSFSETVKYIIKD